MNWPFICLPPPSLPCCASSPLLWHDRSWMQCIDCRHTCDLRTYWLPENALIAGTPAQIIHTYRPITWKQSVIDLSQKHSPFHERTVSCGTTCSPIVIRRSTAPSRQKGRDMLILAQGSNHSVNSFGHSYLNPFGQPAFPQMSGVWGWKSTKLIKCLLHSCFSLWMEYKRRKQH